MVKTILMRVMCTMCPYVSVCVCVWAWVGECLCMCLSVWCVYVCVWYHQFVLKPFYEFEFSCFYWWEKSQCFLWWNRMVENNFVFFLFSKFDLEHSIWNQIKNWRKVSSFLLLLFFGNLFEFCKLYREIFVLSRVCLCFCVKSNKKS